MNDEIVEELVRQIAALEKRLEYMETVEKTVAWTDYSEISTITGFSAYTTKEIWYKKIGNILIVQWNIAGTSDANTCYFTIPYTSTDTTGSASLSRCACEVVDNGGDVTISKAACSYDTANIYGFPMVNTAYNTWTTSGTKSFSGQMIVMLD